MFGNFGEARSNLDKFPNPLSGQKVPFQDQGSPPIAWGPGSSCQHMQQPRFVLIEISGCLAQVVNICSATVCQVFIFVGSCPSCYTNTFYFLLNH
jgi:hypothetical protein